MTGMIRQVAIAGGTHGNELTGIYLVKKFQRFPHLLHRKSFTCITLLANPKAVEANQRYIDRDLNRCFANEDLANPSLTSYEDRRAKEIAVQLGPKKQPKVDFIIDLHSTTANMGLTILPSSKHPFNLRLSAFLNEQHPSVRVCCGVKCDQDTSMLRSLSPLGCAIEVGAIAQGVLNADYLQKTELLIHSILDYLDAVNQGEVPSVPPTLTVYQAISSVDYPRNSSGELQATIHPRLQFRDYEPLYSGEPLFLTFTGESIPYQGENVVYPIFINEAAYYEKKIAMTFTEKKQYRLENS
jgi:succinylglutamate desuccinylase